MKSFLVALAGGVVLLCAPAFAGSADEALFGARVGDTRALACFVRHYDSTHLVSHPQQNVSDMLLLVDRPEAEAGSSSWYTLALGVNFRKIDTQFQVSGGCSGGDGTTLLNCGIDCDGGQIDVRVRDTDSVLVDIPYGARTWDPESDEDPPAGAAFGSDDKLFRLDRTDLAQCIGLAYDDDVKAQIAAAH